MVDLLKDILRLFFIGIFYSAYTLAAYTHFLFNRKDLSVEFLKSAEPKNQKKLLCLFVIYSNKLEKNHLRALDSLYAVGYEVIIIANTPLLLTPEEQAKLFGLFYNHNVGRDIGGYCRAMSYIYKNNLLDQFEKTLFLNDSVIFLNNCKERFEKFANSKSDYTGIASIYIQRYHVPSWCFQLSRTCLLESAVMKFFTNFLPINSRRYLIISGEIKLTQVIAELGYAAHTFDDPESLNDYKKINAFYFPTAPFINLSCSVFNKKITKDPITHDLANKESLDPSLYVIVPSESKKFASLLFAIGRFDCLINRVHLFNLNAALYNDFPFIKKDLYSRGVYSSSSLKAFINELEEKEGSLMAKEVAECILGRQSVFDMPFLKRRLFSYGII